MIKNISVKAIVKPMDLGEYDEGYRGQVLEVWVNPPRAFVIERDEAIAGFVVREQALRKMSVTQSVQTLESLRTKSWLKRMGERLGKPSNELQNAQSEYKDYAEKFVLRMNEWFAKLWSQGEEKETAEQIAELYNAEPALVEWMKRRSVEMLVEHRSNEKKPDGRSARTEQERPNPAPKAITDSAES
jgi:hypothetical protein